MILNFGNKDKTLNKMKRNLDWLKYEMTKGRVNNNNIFLRKETSGMKTPLSIAFVKMVEKGEIDEVTASEHAEMFLDWKENISFNTGDFRTFSTEEKGLKLYRCLQAHTSQVGWTPDVSPSLWKAVGISENGIPEWSQPISSADAYMFNDEVVHNGYMWLSDYDNNVWEPGVFGWHIKDENADNEESNSNEPSSGDEVAE